MNARTIAGSVAVVAAVTIGTVTLTSGGSSPSGSTAPTLGTPGAPIIGEILNSSTGAWGNSPTSYAYRWQRCTATCVNIGGAKGSRYTATSADVGDTLDVVVTATNSSGSASQTSARTGTVTAPSGTLRFEGTMTTDIFPWTSVGGGAQCANYGQASTNGRLRGNLYFTTVQGVPAAQLTNAVDPDPVTWPLQSCNLSGPLAGKPGTLVLPAEEYIALAVYIPADPTVPNSSGRTNISEFHFTLGPQPSLDLMLYSDHVAAAFQSGLYNGSSYQYNASNPLAYAIPPGALVPGQWNEIAFHVRWAKDNTGQAQFYYKTRGASTWQNGSSVSNMPTVMFTSSGSTGTGYFDNAPMNYGNAFTSTYSVYATEVVESGSTLASVQAVMP